MSKKEEKFLKAKLTLWLAIISVIINVIFLIVIIKGEQEINPDTPVEVAALMMEAAGNTNNHASMKELLHKPYQEVVSEGDFQKITEIHTGSAELFSYSVVSFRDKSGEDNVLLLKLTDELDDGKIKIQEIKIVPEEMEQLLID
jgi:hypothetical protein